MASLIHSILHSSCCCVGFVISSSRISSKIQKIDRKHNDNTIIIRHKKHHNSKISFSPLSRKHSSSYQTSLLSNFYKTHEVDVAKTWFELSSSSKKPDEYENFVRISKSFTEFLTQSSSTKLPALLLQYLNLRQSQGSTRESVFSDLKLFQKAVETIASKSNFELPEDRT